MKAKQGPPCPYHRWWNANSWCPRHEHGHDPAAEYSTVFAFMSPDVQPLDFDHIRNLLRRHTDWTLRQRT